MTSSSGNRPAREDLTDEENDDNIDLELRLRTVRTAASAIAESILSEQRAERRRSVQKKRSKFFRRKPSAKQAKTQTGSASASHEIHGIRRNVYVNYPPTAMEVDQYGEILVRYARNKVRTTKYTVFTFLPKNLYEQFRRVANLFFLALVILQLFPVFGAATGATAVLPLAFILLVTAIKDGVEDYRRGLIDEEVNTSAVTKLAGGWRNLNQPSDPRSFFEKLTGVNPPGKVTKGVQRLREKEAEAGMRIMLGRAAESRASISTELAASGDSSLDLSGRGAGGRRLYDIQSMDSHIYPPPSSQNDVTRTSTSPKNSTELNRIGSLSQYRTSHHSQSTIGVIDWSRRTGSARWERTLWKKLEVGDIVLLRDNEQVPADIVVLSTSDADGMCYLETKNLDGETNLKPRKAVKATSSIMSEEDIERASFYLDSEPPHQNLYLYHGVVRYKDASSGELKQEAVTINELLLRGCLLRNTDWIIGLVVFTGSNTKIMLNGGDTPSKRSKIEKETNFNVFVNFGLLTFMCLFSAVFSGIEENKQDSSAAFFERGSEATGNVIINAIVTFMSCLIAFQNIVPISLYISIEIVKTIQAYFISQDIDMYYEPYDTPCVPKTWNISDDLGQIEYVFSDKTGTLTQNVMEFQKCSVQGIAYGEGITEAQRGAATRDGNGHVLDADEVNEKLASLKRNMLATMDRAFKNRYVQTDKLTLVSPKLATDLTDHDSKQRGNLIAFFRALALCHTVLADKPDAHASGGQHRLEYKAESPDEAALVGGARDAGFPFLGRGRDGIDIEVMGQKERYLHMKTLEFNSTRKRMTVVLRCPDGRLVLYCKGADTVIYSRLATDHDEGLKEQTRKDMEMFANGGLRTLCIAYRWMEEEEYLSWSRKYDEATSAIENRDEEIEKASDMIEHSLQILGATALEDKLQEGVPEAIELLHRAGIKLWILTGDKVQTAIEIGYSCNLLKQEMDVMILSADSLQKARSQIEAGLNKIASILGPPSWDSRKRGFTPNAKASFAIVIDGDTLRHALSAQLKELFLNLGAQCETVVCCRVSPAQKAETVKLVKEGRNAMTLSIGDGANDVAMIQEANIGCGLFGLEGSQAAMSADYAFGQFRFLTKLLLVHGRWSYQRVADMHGNFFYKNVIWTFALFWFLPFTAFDPTYLYHFTYILLYNLVFTSLPVIVLGAFDQDINAKAALAFPQLYIRGIRGLEYTRAKFWLYMADGLYQSAVIYFIPHLVWSIGTTSSWTGRDINALVDFGSTVAVAAVLSANSYVGLNTNYWTVMTWIVVFGSTLSMLGWIALYSFFPLSNLIDEVILLFGNITFWSTIIFSTALALGPRFVSKYFLSTYAPLDKDIVREMWVQGDLKDRLGIQRRKPKKTSVTNKTNNLEVAPMFPSQHNRSFSDNSNTHDQYEPANSCSPGPNEFSSKSYLDSPFPGPTNQIPDLEKSLAGSHQREISPLSLYPPAADSPSPQLSYYSASAIPSPSPLPPTEYKYPSGEITTVSPSVRSPRHMSSRNDPAHVEMDVWASSSSPSSSNLAMPHRSEREMSELRLDGPENQLLVSEFGIGQRHDRETMSATYRTAPDNWTVDGEGESVSLVEHSSSVELPDVLSHPAALRPGPVRRRTGETNSNGSPSPTKEETGSPWTAHPSDHWTGGVAM